MVPPIYVLGRKAVQYDAHGTADGQMVVIPGTGDRLENVVRRLMNFIA